MLGEMRPMGGAWGGMTSSPSIGARWRTLVRAAVRLGCARHDADTRRIRGMFEKSEPAAAKARAAEGKARGERTFRGHRDKIE